MEEIDVVVDTPAKVVFNERTGTVVMGADVKISSVAVAHGGISIEVRSNQACLSQMPSLAEQLETIRRYKPEGLSPNIGWWRCFHQ